MKKVSILGQPNVGKSSLFNRFAKSKIAITSSLSGTTRDVNKKIIQLEGNFIQLIDTGGMDEKNTPLSLEISSQIKKNAILAAQNSDLILYVVDGRSYPKQEDKKMLYSLLKMNVPCFLVINKIDNDKQKQEAYEFESFGVQPSFYISVAHNRGINDLIESILHTFNLTPTQTPPYKRKDPYKYFQDLEDFHQNSLKKEPPIDSQEITSPIKIGIIGRVNVGKSSLLNALVGKSRSIVSKQPGTTMDPIEESLFFKGYTLTFIDTAGLRRRGKIIGIEKYALDRTNQMLQESHIALLVLDASSDFTELDEKISSLCDKHNLGVIVVLNKWDIKAKNFEEILSSLRRKFRFLEFAPVLTVSSTRNHHIQQLKEKILEIYKNYSYKIPTRPLNLAIALATSHHPIPSDHGKLVKIYYAAQIDCMPPKIALIMNRPNSLHFSYKRYLVNFLRKKFELMGVPIILLPKNKKIHSLDEEDNKRIYKNEGNS